jgi:hypothetical protein
VHRVHHDGSSIDWENLAVDWTEGRCQDTEACQDAVSMGGRSGDVLSVLGTWSPRTGEFGRRTWPEEKRQGGKQGLRQEGHGIEAVSMARG